jgi:hypothetical protein
LNRPTVVDIKVDPGSWTAADTGAETYIRGVPSAAADGDDLIGVDPNWLVEGESEFEHWHWIAP